VEANNSNDRLLDEVKKLENEIPIKIYFDEQNNEKRIVNS